ncbi:MAG: cobalamin-dependent protein [Thermodesulfobacteriota bacterium]
MPLGLLYVAAALKKARHDVKVYDAIVDAGEERWGIEESPGLFRMGATLDEIRRVVADWSPDVVGIGNPYSSQLPDALKTAEVVKRANPRTRVVVGGPHATVMPSSFLYPGAPVEFAVMGEGEVTVVELLDALMGRRDIKTVKGIAYLDQGRLTIHDKREFIENLDELPLPAYELVDMERYFTFNRKGKDGREYYRYPGAERSVSFITSRGCPFQCTFCSIHLGMGRKFRAHSVNAVLNHIRFLKDQYGLEHIHFEDDNLTFDTMRFVKILNGIRGNGFQITWDTPNGVRADTLDREILMKCRDSGCTYLRIGVESANDQVRSGIIRKRLDLKKVIEVARLCNRLGIDLEAFYVIGFPGENIAQMQETLDFALKEERLHGLYPYGMFTATPLIGTELFRQCLEKGYFSKPPDPLSLATATQGDGLIRTEEFSPEQVTALQRDFDRRHLLAWTLYSLRVLLKHPHYIPLRLRSKGLARHLLSSLFHLNPIPLLVDLLLYRYKNCILRKVRIR